MRRARASRPSHGLSLPVRLDLLREGGWSLRVARRHLPNQVVAWLEVGMRGPIWFVVSSDIKTGA